MKCLIFACETLALLNTSIKVLFPLYPQAHLSTQTCEAHRCPALHHVHQTHPQCFAVATLSPTSTLLWISTSIQVSTPTTTRFFPPQQVCPSVLVFFSFLSLRTFSEKFAFLMTSLQARSWSPIQVFPHALFFPDFPLCLKKKKNCLWNLNLLKCRGATEQWNSQQHANADWTAPRRQVTISTSVHEANIYLGDVKQRSLTSLPSQAAGSMTAKLLTYNGGSRSDDWSAHSVILA